MAWNKWRISFLFLLVFWLIIQGHIVYHLAFHFCIIRHFILSLFFLMRWEHAVPLCSVYNVIVLVHGVKRSSIPLSSHGLPLFCFMTWEREVQSIIAVVDKGMLSISLSRLSDKSERNSKFNYPCGRIETKYSITEIKWIYCLHHQHKCGSQIYTYCWVYFCVVWMYHYSVNGKSSAPHTGSTPGR